MLGILREGLKLNFATEYAVVCGEGGYLFRNSVMTNNKLATYYARNESSINSQYETFLTYYE